MTAARHARQAYDESQRMDADMQDLITGLIHGEVPDAAAVIALQRQLCQVRYYLARAVHDLKLIPQDERRDQSPRITFQPEMSREPRARLPVLTDRIELGPASPATQAFIEEHRQALHAHGRAA